MRKILNHIPSHIRLLANLYILNLIVWFVVRFCFYLVNQSVDVTHVSFYEKYRAFRMGLEFDTAVFFWIGFFPAFFWSIAYLFNKPAITKFTFSIFTFLQLLYLLIVIANIPYFKQFGNHLNKNALLWAESPSFVIGMVFGSFSYWGYLILFIAIAFVVLKLYKRLLKNYLTRIENEKQIKWYGKLITTVFFICLVVLGARGRTSDRSGVHEGLAIVSQNVFINNVAINPNYTFWKSVVYNYKKQAYKAPLNIKEQIAFTRNYLNINSPFEENIKRNIDADTTIHNYNFVIVIMESMTRAKMGLYHYKDLTPNLHNLIKESVFCENFFSSGIHTFNGLFSSTTGYPSIYADKMMKSYVKKPFNGLGVLLNNLNYETYFYITHDPHFDNMQGFYTLNKFQHGISSYDFSFTEEESTLGVPDHMLFDKLIETTNARKNKNPFLAVLMTASDHGPWKIPDNIDFEPTEPNQPDNCTRYADWAIGRFMEQAKKQAWYNNTIFMFLGDHGTSFGHTYEMPISYNHVPYIIHQPKLFKPDTIFSPCYQPDVVSTVMGITGNKYVNETFGINVLKEKHPYVVFSADDKVGCVTHDGFYFYKTENNNQTYLRKYKNLDPVNYVDSNKKLADSIQKSMYFIYNTAHYFLQKDYFQYE